MLILYKQIEQLFNNKGYEFIKINGIEYRELFNCNYNIKVKNSFLKKNIREATAADDNERKTLLRETIQGIDYFINDLNSRQFVIQMKYNDRKDLAGCLSLFQFSIRDNILHLFVFVRTNIKSFFNINKYLIIKF